MADQGQTPNNDGAIWVFMAIVGILAFTIMFHIGIYARPIAFIRGLEVKLISAIPFWSDSFQGYLRLLALKLQIIGEEPDIVKGSKLFEINDEAGRLITWIAVPMFAYMGFKMYRFKRYRRTHTMESLRKSETPYWGRAAMFADLKLDTVNLRNGEWAIALKPNEFALKHKFWDKENETLNLPVLEKVLIKQLGRPLHTKNGVPKDLRKHLKKMLTRDELRLFTLFIVRIQSSVEPEEGKKAETSKYQKMAESLIHKLGLAYANGKFEGVDKEIDAYFKQYGNAPVIREITEQHYYITTFFAGLLARCRTTGVFASADFLWMKKCNRTLWYLLNNMGRRVGWAECAGPWSHYLGESKAQRAYKEPNIRGAIEGFVTYLTR